MTTVTSEEINQFRSALSDNPEAISALQIIEECEGNLDDACKFIIIKSRKDIRAKNFKTSLKELAKKCRNVICQEEFKEQIVDEFFRELLNKLIPAISVQLTLMGNLPVALSVPIAMYLINIGIKNFCESSD